MFPAEGGIFVPEYLGPADHPWLEALLDEARRFAGRPLHEWWARAAEPLSAPAPERRRRLATATLERLCGTEEVPARPAPAELRERLFQAAQLAREAGLPWNRPAILAGVDGLDPLEVADRLFADIPAERRLKLPDPLPMAHALALHTNLAISQGLLRSASSLEVQLSSRSRALIRQVLLFRLLCTVRPCPGGISVEISGPFSLFRHTTMYGRALASVVPVLRGTDAFTVLARCRLQGQGQTVRLTSGDPIFPPGTSPKRYDSKLEERFARDFARIAPDWDLVREPEPVEVDGTFVFPDFALVDRRDGQRRWLVEIVGFWTPEYLATKLERLRRAGRRDLILCVDEKLGCDKELVSVQAAVLFFRGRVDARAVKAVIDRASAPPTVPSAATVVAPPASRTERLGPGQLFLDYAGRRAPEDPIHARLHGLRVGDLVSLRPSGAWLQVVHADGTVIAALSGNARAIWTPRLAAVRAVRVASLLQRTSEQSAPAYRARLCVERWVVPLLEVVVVEDAGEAPRQRTRNAVVPPAPA